MSPSKKDQRFLAVLAGLVLVALLAMSAIYVKPSGRPAASGNAQIRQESGDSYSDTQPQRASNQPSDSPSTKNSDPVPPTANSSSYAFARYDSRPNGYVGTATCKSCHAGRHETYLKTHHSRSLSEVANPAQPHSFTHPASSRSYDVLWKDGITRHRESRYFGDIKQRFTTAEMPACYQMGSGAFAKGFLLTDGDVLLQSPVTWYAKANQWDIAPGYESASHFGMTRVIDDQCMFCHAGLVSQRQGNPYRPVVHELAIGCERCHGPGAEHSELYRQIESGELNKDAITDPKIVHPAQLGRREAESLCAQCHIHGDVVVDAPGRKIWDFRPGEDLALTRVHFRYDQPGEADGAFTGHFDQMWQSECYTKSETLTCMTCHPSHHADEVVDRIAWRRDQCNTCHQEQGCGLPEPQRMKKENDCVACHMPSVDTKIAHTSTTNHFIAVYESGKRRSGMRQDKAILRPVDPSLPLKEDELNRAKVLAQALWRIDNENGDPSGMIQLRDQVAKLQSGEKPDVQVLSITARLNRLAAENTPNVTGSQTAIAELWENAATAARRTLDDEPRPNREREAALEVLGNYLMWSGQHPEAIDHWTELTRIRRAAPDWYNLGLCLARAKRLGDAEKAMLQAITIDGTYAPAYRSLSILYQSTDPQRARQMAQMAGMLSSP